jgi:GNAT superfamily N-acetyltransferase
VSVIVRPAVVADVPAMSAVLIASITELCRDDHRDNPEALASWLANKTPEGVAKWFANPQSTLLVAQRDSEIAACGSISRTDRMILLNYVSPRHRFAGVSKALLADMEARLGPGEARLESSATARRFYLDHGWVEDGPPVPHRFIPGYPMRKLL